MIAAIRLTVRFLRRPEDGRGQAPSFGGVAETFVARNRGARVQAMVRRPEDGRGQAPSFGGVAETFVARNRGARVQAMDI
jgi:hypothetical protein